MHPSPIDQLDPACSATSRRPILFHFLRQLEAMQIVIAIRTGALDFERFQFFRCICCIHVHLMRHTYFVRYPLDGSSSQEL